MPFFCPIPPNTPVDPAGTDTPAGSGPYYVAERIVNQRIVLERNPYYRGGRPANVDRVVWTIGTSREDCLLATEQNRIDLCVTFGIPETAYRRLAETYGVNRAGGQFFVSGRLDTWYFAFNHDRPAFKGPGQIPLMKAINFALDRRALARTFGYLGGKSDDQMLPPTLGRDESIYPLGSGDTATARKWLARARLQPDKLVLYAFTDRSQNVAAAQTFASSLKRIGIDVEVKYFDQLTAFHKTGTRGEPFDVAMVAWSVDYADPASYFGTLLNGENIRQTGNQNVSYFDDPRVNARIEGGKPPDRRGTAQGLGGPRRRPDAEQPALGALLPHYSRRLRVARLRLLRLPPRLWRRLRRSVQEVDGPQALTLARDARHGARVARGIRPRAPGGNASAGEARKGGTLRLGLPADVDFVDPALAYRPWSWPIGYATCAKLFNYPDAPGAAGTRLVPEVVDRYTVSKDGRTYTFTLKKTFRFHTGARVTAQSFADAFNRDRPTEARVTGDRLHARDRRRHRGDRRQGAVDLRRPRARPLPAANPADQASRGLHRPTDTAVLLPGPAEHADRRAEHPAGSGPYYVFERVVNQRIVLKRNPFYRGDRPANVDQVVYTISESQEACLARRRAGPDRPVHVRPPRDGVPGAGREVRHQPTRRAVLRQPQARDVVPRVQPRPARVQGPRPDPAREGDQLRHRPARAARAFGYLAGKRTDQMLPPDLARPESIYPLGGANPATARRWLARARPRPDTLVLYATNNSSSVHQAQVFAFDLKKIGIDLEVKYFDRQGPRWPRLATRGEPFDLALVGWIADYADPASFFVPISRVAAAWASTSTTHASTRESRPRTA